jgi:uncharacterized protein YegL
MDSSYTDITIVLDKSGSMGPLRNDTIGGLNAFLSEQQKKEGDKVLLTVVQFSYGSETTINRQRIEDVEPFTLADYIPSGGTALLDAVGDAISKAGARFRAMNENKRPAKVLFVIITDGEENSSTRYTLDRIKSMITEQQDTYKWQFVFLGANQDAFQSAHNFGIYSWNTSNYVHTSTGVANMYRSLASNVTSYRKDAPEVVQCRSFFQQDIPDVDNSKRTGTSGTGPYVDATGTASNP